MNTLTNIRLYKNNKVVTKKAFKATCSTNLFVPNTKRNSNLLETHTIDLNSNAKNGMYKPIIGRSKEIDKLFQVLLKRTKKNALLVGDAGVGKTAIVEELSRRIVEDEEVNWELQDCTVLQLDVTGMIAGTSTRGDLEKKVTGVLSELVNDNESNYILFIDEIHCLISSKNNSPGNAAGEINIADMLKPALARGKIQCIGATTRDEYVKYFQNDAAFDRRFQYIEIDEPSVETSLRMVTAIKKVYEEYHKCTITDSALKSSVELADKYMPYRKFPDKAIDLIDEACSTVVLKSFRTESDVRVVDDDDIIDVVSKMNNIEIEDIREDTYTKLTRLEKNLRDNIIGQDGAVNAIMKTIKRYTCGLYGTKRPICSMMFLGPTGVGKTEISKLMSEDFFGKTSKLLRFDMSEYMDEMSISSLIGSPPGYVGYNEGGKLTNAIKRNPCSVVLFDEVEKAHPDVLNLLLQILEDGILTDNNKRTYSFRNSIIIMTSNVGSSSYINQRSFGFISESKSISPDLTDYFKPEFINRIDDIVFFNPLNASSMMKIIEVSVEKALSRLEKDIDVFVTNRTKEEIYEKALSDSHYGARPVNRLVEYLVVDRVCDILLRSKGDNIRTIIL